MKPPPIRAWALWVNKYGKWVPVNERPNIPYLYPTKAKAQMAMVGSKRRRWERLYRVEIKAVR